MTRIKYKKNNGFTLIEVLISMILFAIGMLGLAAMQGLAIKDNNDAYMRSRAIFYAYDMGDRITANSAFWRTQITDSASGSTLLATTSSTVTAFSSDYPFCSTDDPPTSSVGTNPTVFCSSTELAQYDWYRWREDVSNALPNGVVSITKTVDPDDLTKFILRVTIQWTTTNSAASQLTATPSFTLDIRA